MRGPGPMTPKTDPIRTVAFATCSMSVFGTSPTLLSTGLARVGHSHVTSVDVRAHAGIDSDERRRAHLAERYLTSACESMPLCGGACWGP